MTEEARSALETTRRGALAGLGVAGVAAVVAACGGGSGGSAGGSSAGSGGSSAHVVHGPAPRPLPVQKIDVAGGKISLA